MSVKYSVKQKRNGINDKELYYAVPAGRGRSDSDNQVKLDETDILN